MKKKMIMIFLLHNCFIIAMEQQAIVPLQQPQPKPTSKGQVTIITELPFDITKNGRYALQKKDKILKIIDVFEGNKERHRDLGITACINTCKDVTWLQLNLKGCVIDCKNFFFPFVYLHQTSTSKDIEIYNGTIKNVTTAAALHVIFNTVKIHDIKFEDCATPIFRSPSTCTLWNIVIFNNGIDESHTLNI